MTQPLDVDAIEQRLRGALLDAIVADGLKPPAERVGLVAAMLAVVRPELDRLRAELDGRRAQALMEGAAKLLQLAKATPYNARAAGLAFSAGVLDQMAEPDPAPTPAQPDPAARTITRLILDT